MPYQGHIKLSWALSAILIIAVLGAIVAFVFVINEEPREKFTEFYILSDSGKASGYPADLEVGSPAEVILGVVNREQEPASYIIEIRIDGVKIGELGPIVLEHNGKSEEPVSFTADKPGEHQKVEFILYRQGQAEADESLHLWVNVKSRRD